MRIVAHNGARIWGGAERATVMLLCGLRDRGHDVVLLCNDDLVIENARARGLRAERGVVGGDVALHHAVGLWRQIDRLSPDSFLIGTWKKVFLASLGARMAGVPRVVARIGLQTDTPRNAKYRYALRHWVDGIAVNSAAIVEPFAALEGFGREKVRVINNGVVTPRRAKEAGSLRRELGIGRERYVVGTVARLVRQKRIDRLLLAVHELPPETHCVIAGDGDERESLEALAGALGLESRVHFLGHREDTADVLDAMDVFIVASDREGLSNAMLEAMSCGLPVVSTPVSGSEDALGSKDDETSSGIIAGFTAESIADAARRLLLDPQRRATLGAVARKRAEQRFSFDAMLDKWEEFLGPPVRPS